MGISILGTGRVVAGCFALAIGACSGSGDSTGTGGSGASSGTGGSGASSGTGGSGASGASGGSGGGGGSSGCPPTCAGANQCVKVCGETPTDYGCCPCPSGTINALQCATDGGGDAAASDGGCGVVGSPCPGATTCGNGLTCVASICAPSSSQCADPPGGVGCGAGENCLNFTAQQTGICVSFEARGCICTGSGAHEFECKP